MTGSNGSNPLWAHSPDAEDSLVSISMIETTAIDEARAAGLNAEAFFLDKPRWAWQAIGAMVDAGHLPELRFVVQRMAQIGKISEDDALSYLLGVANRLSINWRLDLETVLQGQQTRQRARAATQIGSAILRGDDAAASEILQGIVRPSKETAEPWRIYTLRDAYAPREPVQFIVAGLFPLPSLSMIYGTPGTLKSMLLADMIACVAGGVGWLSPMPDQPGAARAVIQSPVLWCDFDNGARRTHERFEAVGRAHNLGEDAPLFYVSMPSPWLDAGDNTGIVMLADRIMARGVRLVVLDNLGVITGKIDENSALMTTVLGNLRWLCEHCGIALIVIHHQRKANGLLGRSGESLRGHSSIEAALDLALLIEREEHSAMINIRSTKTRDVDVMPFGAQFAFEHKPGSNELAAALFWGVAVPDTVSDKAVKAAILSVIEVQHPLNQSQLKERIKEILPDVGHNRIGQLANAMAADGKLLAITGARGAKLYDILP